MITNAYLYTGDEKYKRWVLDYAEAWMERIRANHGTIPDNIGPTGKIGEHRGGQWWGGFGVYRNFRVTEKLNLQFRSEFFNILNHTNFGMPSAGLGNPAAFGKILSTSGGLYGEGAYADPRIIQFALKLVF